MNNYRLPQLCNLFYEQAFITAFEELNERFRGMVLTPRADIAGRKAANISLEEQFDDTSGLLENQLDRLMVRFKNSHPDFDAANMNARVIVDHEMRHEKNGEQATTESPE